MFEEKRPRDESVRSRIAAGERQPAATRLVAGEPFSVEDVEGDVLLSHPMWSLMGRGADMAAAEANLYDEAAELAEVFLALPVEKLDSEALRLRQFLLKIVG